MNAGQVCSSVERVYVERSVAEEFAELCAEEVRTKYLAGAPDNADAKLGPLVSMIQKQKIERHLADALDKGAVRLLCSAGVGVSGHGVAII